MSIFDLLFYVIAMIETERLVLRRFALQDSQNMYLLNQDSEVLKYTGDVPFPNISAAHSFIENYDQYEKYGIGRYAVILKSDNSFLGWCGLKYSPDKDEYDIGFRFLRKYWNNGYATEASKACIKYGFENLGLTTIVGRAVRQNFASIAVLKKVGLQYYTDFDFEGNDGVIYKIERA